MSDLSFNVIALDRASKTFLSAAESIDRMVAKLDRLDGKQATATVNIKTDESKKALDSFTNRFALMTAGIAAASPVAGAAILAGVGAGIAGVAILAQKSNQQVQDTYKTLWSNVVGQTQAATSQLVPQIVGAGNQIGHTFQALEPQMRRAFSAAGPDIQALTTGVTQFATNAMPGVTSSMQNSLPVFEGVRQASSDLGTAFGTSLGTIGQNATAYGATIQSFGQITSTVLVLAVSLVNNLAQVWAASGQDISAAISSVAQVASGLAGGAVPVLVAGLTAAAQIITVVANVLEPLSPILGTVGAAALATWAAFKLAGAVTAGVNALAGSVLSMGASMEAGATRAAAAGIAIQGVGARAATAAVGTAAVAESLAGPVGIAVAAATIGFTLLSGTMGNSATSAQDLAGAMGGVTSALQASNGAITGSVIAAVQSDEGFKKAAESAKQFGIDQSALVPVITGQGDAYKNLITQLQGVVDANHEVESSESGDTRVSQDKLNATGTQAKLLIDILNTLAGKFRDNKAAADQQNQALQNNASTLTRSSAGMAAASNYAQAFGTNVFDGVEALRAMALASGDSAATVDSLTRAMGRNILATANAGAAITNTFTQADAQVAQARQSVSQAAHGVEQASRAVADAQHGEATAARGLAEAQQGVADAQRGVVTAQRAYADAQRAERDAQVSLNEARQQAIRDLKALHQQLDDQFTTEASARVRLFDAQTAGLNLGINASNARQIASGPVTAENEAQVKAAIDLLSAQNSLNAAVQNGMYLKQDVAAADARGVEGSKGVVSAQQQLTSAQRQVQDASYGVEQAQRAVVRAQQAVADASYAQQRAHQAVRDAQYQQAQASQQLTTANQALGAAVDATSRSFDINTEAGRRNIGLLQTLSDAIIKQYGPTAAGYNQLIQQTADKFGITTGAAEGLLHKLGEIPQDFKFGMTAVASVDTAALNAVFRGTSAGGYFNDSMNVRKTIGGTGYATGGHFRGMGGPRDDANIIAVSDNEFITQAAAVDFWGVDTLNDINNMRMPKKFLGKYATGGLVQMDVIQANAFGAGAGLAYGSNINAFEAMGIKHPPQLPKWEPPVFDIPNFATGSGVQQWSGAALAAMGELGIPGNFLPAVLRRMMQESGGNPTVVNRWDSNWTRGTPSVGLMQVIGPTFRSNAGPHVGTGPFMYGVSVDPVSNIYAGLNYAGRRYGGGNGGFLGGVLYAMGKPGGYASGGLVMPRPRAYDNGGALPPGLSTVWNGTGRPENVRTSNQEDAIVKAIEGLKGAITAMADRPIEGTAVLDSGKLVGVLRGVIRDLEFQSSGGRL